MDVRWVGFHPPEKNDFLKGHEVHKFAGGAHRGRVNDGSVEGVDDLRSSHKHGRYPGGRRQEVVQVRKRAAGRAWHDGRVQREGDRSWPFCRHWLEEVVVVLLLVGFSLFRFDRLK